MGLIFTIIVVLIVLWVLRDRVKNQRISQLQQQKIKEYQEKHQLTKADLQVFRQQMRELKENIIQLEQITQGNTDLKKIEKAEAGLASAKEIFQELMAHPNDLTKYGDFSYKKLPSLLDASVRLEEIQKSNLQTPEIKISLTRIKETIQFISASITDDYERIVAEDSEEIALAREYIGEKND